MTLGWQSPCAAGSGIHPKKHKRQKKPQKAQKAQNEFLDLESCRSQDSFCVFVPFVAIEIQTANGFGVP